MNNNIKFSYPDSEKVYIKGKIFPQLKVAMRKINLTPTVDIIEGKSIITPNPPVYVYDTSGPYSDPDIKIDLKK